MDSALLPPHDTSLDCPCTVHFLDHGRHGVTVKRIELCPLHAAAPELLTALEALALLSPVQLRALDSGRTDDADALAAVFTLARAAVAKARGER